MRDRNRQVRNVNEGLESQTDIDNFAKYLAIIESAVQHGEPATTAELRMFYDLYLKLRDIVSSEHLRYVFKYYNIALANALSYENGFRSGDAAKRFTDSANAMVQVARQSLNGRL